MSDTSTIPLPARRRSLVLLALPDMHQFLVKNGPNDFYDLDEQSYFLLERLDGQASAEEVSAAYHAQFDELLTAEDLAEFVRTARELGFLEEAPTPTDKAVGSEEETTTAQSSSIGPNPGVRSGNSLLHFRVRLVNPDRLLTWLAPKLWFFWTPAFVLLATLGILVAAVVAWNRRADLTHSFPDALAWRTVVLAWITLGVVTVLHEFAHGLTCKRFGGEVRDMGFLMLYFTPCFYANVSDAWLFPKRSQRLWVTFAGGFFELWLWSLAVFAWAALQPGTLSHRAAYLIAVMCGVQTLFNFNPLIKLDGYYLLSDWLGIVNLRERALVHVMAWLRRWLWGAAPPESAACGGLLLVYGLVSLVYSVALLAFGLFVMARVAAGFLGAVGWVAVGLLALLSLRGVFTGIFQGEVKQMLLKRFVRTLAWTLGLTAVPLALLVIPITDRSGGACRLRPAMRVEVRAPVAGFVEIVYADEGAAIHSRTVLAVLDVPDLASRAEQKQAELREARARLRLLEAGPRCEEVHQQRRRVERATAWRDLATQDLERARQALRAEEKRLDEQIAQQQAEREYADGVHKRLVRLKGQGAASQDDYSASEKLRRVAHALEQQAQAQKRVRQILGTQDAEAELARRDKELADDQAKLALLEAGSRTEEIEAERARLARLEEEARHLGRLKEKTQVMCRSHGVVVTPRLREKVGQYVKEGDLIAVIEDTACLDVEVALAEDESARVAVGQRVGLKFRALPHETFAAQVVRIAPIAKVTDPGKPEEVGRVTVYCSLDGPSERLRSGMTGYARIYSTERSLGGYLLDRAVRFVRTEFWW